MFIWRDNQILQTLAGEPVSAARGTGLSLVRGEAHAVARTRTRRSAGTQAATTLPTHASPLMAILYNRLNYE